MGTTLEKSDASITLRVPRYVKDKIEEIAALWGMTTTDFLRMLIERSVFGAVYSVETDVEAALEELIDGGLLHTDLEAILSLVRRTAQQVIIKKGGKSHDKTL